jgi:hypothetical protein
MMRGDPKKQCKISESWIKAAALYNLESLLKAALR